MAKPIRKYGDFAMFDPAVLTAFGALFGQVAGPLLRKAAEKHVETYFGKALDKVASVGQKSAFQEAMERAFGGWTEAVLKNLEGLGYDAEDLAEYKESFERMLQDEEVGRELARPLLDGEVWRGPEVALFQDAWARLGCRPLPRGFQWPVALDAFERQVKKQRVFTEDLREQLNAINLVAIREELERLGGVRPEANERRYAQAMRDRYRVLDLAALAPPAEERLQDLQLRDVFLPQDVRENPPSLELPWDLQLKFGGSAEDLEHEAEAEPFPEELSRLRQAWMSSSYSKQQRRPVLDVLREAASQRIVLLGDPGSGKSTLTKYLLLSILGPPWEAETGTFQGYFQEFYGHLPLLIELREYIAERSRGKCENFLDFLDQLGQTQGYALEKKWLAKRLCNGPSLVFFDGLDEIFDVGDREWVMHGIAGFSREFTKARVVVTSRMVGYSDRILRAVGFRHFAIEDLDDSQVERFVRGWFGLTFSGRPEEAALRIERVLQACEQSRSVRLLAGNPMLLTIMAMIARQHELPRERAKLYQYSADVLCHHWDVNRRLRDVGLKFKYIGLADKNEFLRRIAFRMQNVRQCLAGNFIHENELQCEIETYLAERYRVNPTEAKTAAVALIEQLHSRNYILCLYGPGLYGFMNRTLLEYFCAAELTRRVHEDTDYTIEKLIEGVIAEHWQRYSWWEVLRLLCGMVGEKHAGRIIEYLATQVNPSWRTDGESPRHIILAIHCLGEVRDRYAIERASLSLLQEIVTVLENPANAGDLWMETVHKELPRALKEVGTTWPGSEWLREHFIERGNRIGDWFQSIYIKMVVSLLGTSDFLRGELWRLSKNENWMVRIAALEALAQGWPRDNQIRELLQDCALYDHWAVRSAALDSLSRAWAQDSALREFLQCRTLQDASPYVRCVALRALSRTWPQETTVHALLRQCALKDEQSSVRGAALASLVRSRPQDTTTRELLQNRALQDDDAGVRHIAMDGLLQITPLDRVVIATLSWNLDGQRPFLDPREAIPERHLQEAATRSGITPEELESLLVQSGNALGWDPRKGMEAP